MQNFFSATLSEAVSSHIRLSPARQETLGWLVYLVMRHGTICLWRLAAHVATAAQTASVRRRFYRFFQFVRLDGTAGARMVAALLGLEGRPWVLAMDRTNWEFGQRRSRCRPDARSSRTCSGEGRQRPASQRASPFF